MVVTGVVVNIAPEKHQEVMVAIKNVKKVSTSRIMDENKILAIIDTENKVEEAATFEEIMQIKGVIRISLAYHHFES